VFSEARAHARGRGGMLGKDPRRHVGRAAGASGEVLRTVSGTDSMNANSRHQASGNVE
jgi:hypothetical protein